MLAHKILIDKPWWILKVSLSKLLSLYLLWDGLFDTIFGGFRTRLGRYTLQKISISNSRISLREGLSELHKSPWFPLRKLHTSIPLNNLHMLLCLLIIYANLYCNISCFNEHSVWWGGTVALNMLLLLKSLENFLKKTRIWCREIHRDIHALCCWFVAFF